MGENNLSMFKHKDCFDYAIQGTRANNCVLVDANKWLANTSNEIIGVNNKGGIAQNFITEVLAVNNIGGTPVSLQAGDVILMTSVAAKCYCSTPFEIPVAFDTTKYADIPISHIIGKFIKHISLPSLELFHNYVLLKPVKEARQYNDVYTTGEMETIHEVVLTGPNTKSVKSGMTVLIRDNITTPVMLNSEFYYACTEDMVIAELNKNDLSIDGIKTLFTGHVILDEYVPETIIDGGKINAPTYNKEDEDAIYSTYRTDRYVCLKSSLDVLEPQDILFVPRGAVSYVTIRGRRYYTMFGKDFMIGKIRK